MLRDTKHVFALVIDFQERIVPAMAESQELVQSTRILLRGLRELGIPLVVSEQYPKGLGPTLPEVAECFPAGCIPIPKVSFDAMDTPQIAEAVATLGEEGRRTALVLGIESHVCALQSALGLLERGYGVYMVEDCVASRYISDKHCALKRARDAGAVITTAETLLFELIGGADSPHFKAISKIVK